MEVGHTEVRPASLGQWQSADHHTDQHRGAKLKGVHESLCIWNLTGTGSQALWEVLLELESEGGGITGWRKEGRASHRRHPSRLGCGGGNEQDREEQSVVRSRHLGPTSWSAPVPCWPWHVAGFSLQLSAAGSYEWELWDSLLCRRVLGQQCPNHKGEGPRRGWQARWAGERCVVIDCRCVSVCVKNECVWLQYYLLHLGVQVKQVCPWLDNHWWWLMGPCMSIIFFSLLCVYLKFLTVHFFLKLLP